MKNIFNIKNNLLIKKSQGIDEDDFYYTDDDSDVDSSIESEIDGSIIAPESGPKSISSDVPDKIKIMVASYFNLLNNNNNDEANSLLLDIYSMAAALKTKREDVDNYIQESFASETPSGDFISSDDGDDSSGQEWQDNTGISSFSDMLWNLNRYIKETLKNDIVPLMLDGGLIDYSKSGSGRNRIFSRKKKSEDRKEDFLQWVEISIFDSDKPILFSEGVGAYKKHDDIALFLATNTQYLPAEYFKVTKTKSSSKIRSSYLKVVNNINGVPRPLFYYLLQKIYDLVDERNKDLISYCVNRIRITYNDIHSKAQFKEKGESSFGDISDGHPGIAGLPGSSTPDDFMGDILDWRAANEEKAKSLDDDEILEIIRRELIDDKKTKKMIENLRDLPRLYSSIVSAKSKIETIKNKLIFDISEKIKKEKDSSQNKRSLKLFEDIIKNMMDRYSKSLEAISERIKKSSDEGISPSDIGLRIDILNDNLISFTFGKDEILMDPLNESGSFDFKSKIPFDKALDKFDISSTESGDVGIMDGVLSGDESSIQKLVDMIVEDYDFAIHFVAGIKKMDDNYNPAKRGNEKYGLSTDVYDLEIAIRETFYDYRKDDYGQRIQQKKTVGGQRPRYSANVSREMFDSTKGKRKKILDSYRMSASGSEIRNISTIQSAVKSFQKGSAAVRRGISGNLIRTSTRNLALDSLEELFESFKDDNTAKSILASVLTNLRADLIMCNLLGTVGKKAFRKGIDVSVVESFNDLMSIANDNDQRIIKLYVNLFDVGSGTDINIRDLKIHCLKNKYSYLTPEYRFALISHAIATNTINDALTENTSAGSTRAKQLVSNAINRRSYTLEDVYLKKISSVISRLESLKV